MSHASRNIWRLGLALLVSSLLPGVTAANDGEPQSRPVAVSAAVRQDSPATERDKLWNAALESARKSEWTDAARSGLAALKLHERSFADQPLETCRMLESLSYWYTQQRQFPAALITAQRLLARRRELLGEQHWQTVDARLHVAFVDRFSNLSNQESQQFQAAEKLHTEAVRLANSRRYSDALVKAEAAHPIYSRILEDNHPLTLGCVATIALCQIELGQYMPARANIRNLEPQVEHHGLLHPQSIHTYKLLARYNEATSNWSEAEENCRIIVKILTVMAGGNHLETVAARVDLAKIYVEREKYSEAESILVTALKRQQEQLGQEHLSTAQTMKVLGGLYCRIGKFSDAEPLLNKCVAVFSRQAGDQHPATAGALNARGRLRMETWRFELALIDFNESLAICNKSLGENHPLTAKVLDNQAALYEYGANSGMARQVRLQCLRICEQTFGEISLQTASALENIARTNLAMHDYGLAETYLLRARETRRKLLGDENPQTAIIVGQLGYAYLGVGDPNRARPLLQEALRILDKQSAHDPVEAARIRLKLALLYQGNDEFPAAEAEYRRALRTLEQSIRKEYFLVAAAKVGLGQTLVSRDNLAEARRHLEDAKKIYGPLLHKDDPHWIDALAVSGMAHLAAGENELAERDLRRGLQVAQLRMLTSGAFESERQRLSQFMMLRSLLDLYLSLPADTTATGSTSADVVYPHVLTWKGGVASRQWRDRQFATPATAPLTTELQQISRKLSTLSLRAPATEEREKWMRRIFELTLRKEALEQQRAAAVTGRADVRDEVVTPQQLRQSLPADVVLIDILQYSEASFEKLNDALQLVKRQKYAAFIVRRDRDVQRIDLGNVPPIADAVSQWRKTRGFRPNPGKTDWAAVAGSLVWPQLKPHVEGCRTILISPDGMLSQLAWNVLPGDRSNSYLIEDFAIGVIPIPQLLPAIIAHRRPLPNLEKDNRDSLLLVGGVDYDAAPSSTSKASEIAGSGGRLNFSHLAGTVAEIKALREQFQRRFPSSEVVVLEKDTATESAFWREAPRHRWLHVATHGFFAPAAIRSAIAIQNVGDPSSRQSGSSNNGTPTGRVSVFHVGFLNGLALTGANVSVTGEGDDGILTAAELSTMDLRKVDVAVLSGCETGLGEVQAGEGSFGMQRALQIAGAQATVGSLWTVSDEKTNSLMQRFYSNLWDKKLSRLEALREAQLWLLQTGGSPAGQQTPTGKRTSPHYWAPFMLSGDWR